MKKNRIREHGMIVFTPKVWAKISLVLSLLGVIVIFFIPYFIFELSKRILYEEAFITFIFFFPIVTNISSIISGHIARSKIKIMENIPTVIKDSSKLGSGLAISGLIISYLSLISYLVLIFIFASAVILLRIGILD